MPGKRKADDMASPSSGKPSKKAALEAARKRAQEFAQRDKEKIQKAKAKKTSAPSKPQQQPAKPETPDKKLSVAERKKIALKNAQAFAARDKAKLESQKESKSSSPSKKKAAPTKTKQEPKPPKETKAKKPSSNQQRKETPASQLTGVAVPLKASPQLAPSIGPMEVVDQTQAMANANIAAAQYQAMLQNSQNPGYAAEAGFSPTSPVIQHLMLNKQLWQQQQQQQEAWHALQRQQQTMEEAWRYQQQVAAARQYMLQQVTNNDSNIAHRMAGAVGTERQPPTVSSSGNVAVPPLKPVKTTKPTPKNAKKAATPIVKPVISKSSADDGDRVVNEEEDKDIEFPPPPAGLTQEQVSQIVLLNAQNDTGPLSSEEEEDVEEVVEQEVGGVDPTGERGKEAKATKERKLQILAAVIVAVLGVICIQMLPAPPVEELLTPEDSAIPTATVCYYNSDSEYEEFCLDETNAALCPGGTTCEGGKLVGCRNSFQTVSEKGDGCVLAEEYLPMKAAILDQLVSHTSQICDQSSTPSFKYALVQKEHPDIPEDESDDLIEVLTAEGFGVQEVDGLYIGLPEGFKVHLPFHCHLGNICQWVLQKFGLIILGLFSFACGVVAANPILSAVAACILVGVLKFRQYRASKAKRDEDIKQTRKLAYRTLEESPGVEHWAVHIRDEIARALYPDSKKLQLQLQKTVWPKIVADVKRDTRVRKVQKTNKDGKIWDVWQWTAAAKVQAKETTTTL